MRREPTKKCPECKSENFGVGSGEPVQTGGWYGDKRFAWGQHAGVHMCKLIAVRCGDCGHEQEIDPQWDR